MRVVLCDSAEQASQRAASAIADVLSEGGWTTLALPTGETPRRTYALLRAAHRSGNIDFEHARSVNLDELIGLGAEDDRSYRRYMTEHLFGPVGLPESRTLFPPTEGTDLDGPCRLFEQQLVAWGGIDLALLGLGRNGHIAFNEPGSAFDSRTRVVRLSKMTRAAMATSFRSSTAIPTHATTLGIGTLLEARRVVLLALGAAKANAVRAMISPPPSTRCPASALQHHPRATLLLDPAAARLLCGDPEPTTPFARQHGAGEL